MIRPTTAQGKNTNIAACAFVHKCMYICACMYVHCMYIRILICTCNYRPTYICMYIRMYIHEYSTHTNSTMIPPHKYICT